MTAGPDDGGPADASLARRRDERRARWRYVRVPLLALAVLLLAGVVPASVGWFDYFDVVPLLLVFAAVGVAFLGAWHDFGAGRVLAEVRAARLPLRAADLERIHRQQLLLTLAYLAVAGLYVLVAVLLAAVR